MRLCSLKYKKRGAERLILIKHVYIIKGWVEAQMQQVILCRHGKRSLLWRNINEETNKKPRENIGIQLMAE